jgi:hypothetical protein
VVSMSQLDWHPNRRRKNTAIGRSATPVSWQRSGPDGKPRRWRMQPIGNRARGRANAEPEGPAITRTHPSTGRSVDGQTGQARRRAQVNRIPTHSRSSRHSAAGEGPDPAPPRQNAWQGEGRKRIPGQPGKICCLGSPSFPIAVALAAACGTAPAPRGSAAKTASCPRRHHAVQIKPNLKDRIHVGPTLRLMSTSPKDATSGFSRLPFRRNGCGYVYGCFRTGSPGAGAKPRDRNQVRPAINFTKAACI